jgi:hypothetical protein
MSEKLLADLISKGALALLQFSADEWNDVINTRKGPSRFSLTFEHPVASSVRKNSLVLIAIASGQYVDAICDTRESSALFLGVVGSIAPVATFSSRVVFERVEKISPGSLEVLLDRVTDAKFRNAIAALGNRPSKYSAVSPKLGGCLIGLIASVSHNKPTLQRILSLLDAPRRFDNARALQQNALRAALKVFGAGDEADAVFLDGGDTTLTGVRFREDLVVEHDARSVPGWTLKASYQTGRAIFRRDGQQLDVITANKQPLEQIFGVDLIYLNHTHRSLVMMQYKMLEPVERRSFEGFRKDAEPDEKEWLVRLDQQFKSELARMAQFDRDLSPEGAFRLNSGAFFFKLVRRCAATNTAGIILSLGHLNRLIKSGALHGPQGGLRISYDALGGHYLRGEAFIELVRSGYIGTRDATTDQLEALIEAALVNGHAVVAAVQSARRDRVVDIQAVEF